jgi:hypothetical protein
MLRKSWLIPLFLLLLVCQLSARPNNAIEDNGLYNPSALGADARQAAKLITPETDFNVNRVSQVPYRDDPADVAVGEDMVIGYTWYDYQHNGSVGKMVARDSQGGTHFTWMCGYDAQQGTRHMLYNFLDANGNLLNGADDRGVVDNADRSGYGNIGLLPLDERAGVFYHLTGHQDDPAYLGTALSVDWMSGIGAFQPSYPISWPEIELAWPKGTFDSGNFAHVVATENSGEDQSWQRVGYWRGIPDNEYLNWSWNNGNVAINVDTSGVISSVAAASKQSRKVALAWHHNRIGADQGIWSEYGGAWQRNNDIRYIISEDGENWDWDEGIESMTKIIPPNPDLFDIDLHEAYGDTFRPYCDIDIQFDPWEDGDNLYGVFSASGFRELPFPDEDGAPLDGMYSEQCYLWFWSSNGGVDEADTITVIADGWYSNVTDNPLMPENRSRRTGVWRTNADRGSLAFDATNPGTIYCVWVNFPKIMELAEDENGELFWSYLEGAQDTSEAGYNNAEIMVSVSDDFGIHWRQPVNVTGTVWEGDDAPAPGDCMSENWSSVAEVADGELHIMYIRDTDAGGIPQEEGSATNSPVIYHKIALEDIPETELVVIPEGLMFHNYPDFAPRVDNIARAQGAPLPNEAVNVTSEVTAMGGRGLADVVLEYVVITDGDDDTLSVAMDNPDGDNYAAEIPGLGDGSYVWYRIVANDDEDGQSVKPSGYWYAYVVRPADGLQIHDIQYRPAEWQTDYSSYKDYEVTVTGVVTTPSDFNTTIGGMAIQDQSAEWSGVYVRGALNEAVNVGDLVSVTGVVMERDENDPRWRWGTYINVDDQDNITVIGEGEEIDPIVVSIQDISSMTFLAENYEGVLVKAEAIQVGALTNDDFPTYIPITEFGEEPEFSAWMTTNGLLEDQIDELEMETWVHGTTIEWVIGVFSENQRYGIAPRTDADFGRVDAPLTEDLTPVQFALDPAYPNPFNSMTNVGFEISRAGWVNLAVYDLAGRLVSSIVDGNVQAGHFTSTLDASQLSTGVYILRLDTEQASASQKIVLVK